MIRVAPSLALCLPLLLASPAWAQVPPPVMDQVVLDLTAEDWVGTETARVTVSADAAATGTDAGTQRADLLRAIDGLAPDAEWRIVSFDRSTDQAGLERWRAVAEALGRDEAVLEYLLSDKGSLVYVITRDTLVGIPLGVTQHDVARAAAPAAS